MTKRLLGCLLILCAALGTAAPTPARAEAGVAPVPGPIVGAFEPPSQPWLAGHRGIDLLAEPSSAVVAALSGEVGFVGMIAGRAVVVINHGATRTTYEPVSSTLRVGTPVTAGAVIGVLQSGHHCAGGECLHMGWLRGDRYLDPGSLFPRTGLRLLPADAEQTVRELLTKRPAAGSGVLLQPVSGGIGSPFGMRLHPIFHTWRMHSGVDIGAACQTPIRAAAAGVVVSRSYDSASGNRLSIDHGLIGGEHLITHYLHASSYSVGIGTPVRAGEVVGAVGSTGWSTGCHLHFSVWADGSLVDPQHYL